MQPVSLLQFFSTTRDFPKYIIDEERRLTTVPAFQVALDHSPNSGLRLGILAEQGSTNYFLDSENLTSGVSRSSNVSITNQSIAGSPKSAMFPSSKSNSWIGCDVGITADWVAVTFYVAQKNFRKPVLGYGSADDTSVTLRFDDYEINMAAADVDIQGPLNDMSYRVRVRAMVPGGYLANVKIYKTFRQTYGLEVSRVQVEKDMWTSYIPTTGTVQSRVGETVYRNMTHGVEFNEDQGTFDVVYSPTPGSLGSPMTVLKSDWTEYVAIGHQYDVDGFPEAARFHSDSNQFDRLSYHDPDRGIREKYSAIRFSYSGYGARVTIGNGGRIAHLKDFDSFRNGKFDRFQFGESYDGSHFTGHIHLLNIYARTFNNSEIRDFRYNVNTSSETYDTDLEESTLSATAAAVFRTDLEANLYKNVVEPPTPQRILAAWPRASSFTYFPDPSEIPPTDDPANTWSAGRWYYNGTLDAFVQPINSNKFEQIFSPLRIDTFEFEATMYADPMTDGYWDDDDYVGLVAASDIINGDLVTVAVGTHSGGLSIPRFSITLMDNSVSGPYGNVFNVLAGSNFLTKSKTADGGRTGLYTRIRVTRAGPFLRAVATQWNDLGNFREDQELVVNLASLPGKGKLLADRPARYGFCSLSNTGSTYLDYDIRSDQVINDLKIYSEESNTFWQFTEGSWQLQVETASDDLLPATRVNNRVTKENYTIDETTAVMEFARNNGISYGEGTITVPASSTTDIEFSEIINQYEYENELFFFNSYEEVNVIAEQVSGKLRIVSEATNGSFYVLLGTEPETDAFGITDETIGFRKINVVVS